MELTFLSLSELSTSLVPAVTSSVLLKPSATKAIDWLSTKLYLVVVLEQNLNEVKSTTHCRQNQTEIRCTGDAGAVHVMTASAHIQWPRQATLRRNIGGSRTRSYCTHFTDRRTPTGSFGRVRSYHRQFWTGRTHHRQFWTRKESPQTVFDV